MRRAGSRPRGGGIGLGRAVGDRRDDRRRPFVERRHADQLESFRPAPPAGIRRVLRQLLMLVFISVLVRLNLTLPVVLLVLNAWTTHIWPLHVRQGSAVRRVAAGAGPRHRDAYGAGLGDAGPAVGTTRRPRVRGVVAGAVGWLASTRSLPSGPGGAAHAGSPAWRRSSVSAVTYESPTGHRRRDLSIKHCAKRMEVEVPS